MNIKAEPLLKVIIADEHPFFRDGFQMALKKIRGISKITHAIDGTEVLRTLSKELHHIVFMDVKMPVMNGIETTKKIAKTYPGVKVIVVSMHDDMKKIIQIINSGAAGYILKNTNKNEVERAIADVTTGRNYFSPNLSGEIFQKLISIQNRKALPDKIELLTLREKEILELICKQLTTGEISETLFISVKTVETHRGDLLRKTKSKNAAGLALWAIKNGYCEEV